MYRWTSLLVLGLGFTACGANSAFTSWETEPAATPNDLASVWCTTAGGVYAVDSDGKPVILRPGGPRLSWDRNGPVASLGGAMVQVAGGSLRQSTDGGKSWTTLASATMPGEVSYGRGTLSAVGATSGRLFALGRYVAISNSLESDYAYLLRSDDGGATWKRVWAGPDRGPIGMGRNSDPDVGSALATLPSGTIVMSAASTGGVVLSTDGGSTVSLHETPSPGPLADLWVSPGGAVIGVGPRGAIVVSHDGGRTFRSAPSGVKEDLRAIEACGNEVWIVGARGTVLHSKVPSS